MTADDLNAPLGQQLRKRRQSIPITTSQVMAAVLTLFLGVFVVWAVVVNNPFGGEPIVVVPINLHPGPAAKTANGQAPPKVVAVNPDAPAAAQAAPGQTVASPAATKTITIIDGTTGERKEVAIPAPAKTQPPRPTPARSTRNSSKCRPMAPFPKSPPTACDRQTPSPSRPRRCPASPTRRASPSSSAGWASATAPPRTLSPSCPEQ